MADLWADKQKKKNQRKIMGGGGGEPCPRGAAPARPHL